MANKKKDVQYHKGRAGLLYAILTVVLITASVVAACTVFFRVESVVVEGNDRYSEEMVLTVAKVELGSNLVLMPKEQIAQRLQDELPYLDQVKIQKRLPTTLKIVVTETLPMAVVASGEDLWVMDAKGKLLEKADEAMALEFIEVEGLEVVEPQQGAQAQAAPESTDQLEGLLALLQVIQKQGMTEDISSINVASKTEVTMMYAGRLKVKMLRNADFDRKVQILKEITAVLGEQAQGTVDLKTERGIYSPGG